METVTLYRGSDYDIGHQLLNRTCQNITWWSTVDSIIDHYGGMALKLVLQINTEEENDYIREYEDNYTGFGRAEMRCPEGHIWYSISPKYLFENVISIEEIFEWTRDLEEEDDSED